MTTGLSGERGLDSADKLRLDQMLREMAWAPSHVWDRTLRGIFPKGTFEQTGREAQPATDAPGCRSRKDAASVSIYLGADSCVRIAASTCERSTSPLNRAATSPRRSIRKLWGRPRILP